MKGLILDTSNVDHSTKGYLVRNKKDQEPLQYIGQRVFQSRKIYFMLLKSTRLLAAL
jgi:hypothetical protein